jgi:hypothetical protein
MDNTSPKFLESAFSKDFTFTDYEKQQFDFYVHDMGKLAITEGKIIACDPYIYDADPAFAATFPIGEFPVQLAIAKVKDDERVAMARINFSAQQTPVKWEMAIIPGQDLFTLKKGEIFGYPVDAGTAAFMNEASAPLLAAVINEDYGAALADEMEASYKNTWSWLMKKLDDHTIAVFSSGWGDGFYASYIGTDANGNICRLVTDFGVIGEE